MKTLATGRRPAKVWAKFWDLKKHEMFSIGNVTYSKVGLCRAQPFTKAESDPIFISPLRRVRTTRDVAKPRSLLDLLANKDAKKITATVSQVLATKSPFLSLVESGKFSATSSEPIAGQFKDQLAKADHPMDHDITCYEGMEKPDITGPTS